MKLNGTTSYRIGDQNALHFITFATVGWIDVFTRRRYKDILIESLDYCRKNKGLELFSFVIMSNHVHLVASAKEGFQLSDILRDFKKFTSKKVIAELQNDGESRREWMLMLFKKAGFENSKNKEYQLWRNDNHPIALTNSLMVDQKIDYIENNPVMEGIVESPEDYLYSSASIVNGRSKMIELDEL